MALGVAPAGAFRYSCRPLIRMVGVAVRGSVGDPSRSAPCLTEANPPGRRPRVVCGGFLRVYGASIPPAPRAGLCQARPSRVRAGERCGPSVRRCASRLGRGPPVPRRDSWICGNTELFGFKSSDRSLGGPRQTNRLGPGPYGLGTCVRQGPAARSSAVQNLGPVSIKYSEAAY
jgi:hypothetical protein